MTARKPLRFDAAWHKRRVRAARWRRLRWWLVVLTVLLLAALASLWPGPRVAEWQEVTRRFTICGVQSSAACVVDGDTLVWGKRRIRLAGYDAPELDGACEAERGRALEARDALAAWLAAGPFEWDGGAEPPFDQYGRELRSIRRGGEDLAQTMIARGLAQDGGWARQEGYWCE